VLSSAVHWSLATNQEPPTTVDTILVMMLGDVGDVLLATPALRQLRDASPDAHITALTKPTTMPVLAQAGLVDAFLPVDKHLVDRPTALLRPGVALGLLRFACELRRRRFDAVVVLHHLVTLWGTVKFAGLALATGAPIRAGLDNGRGVFFTHRARDLGFDAAHEAEYWSRIVALVAPHPPTPSPSRGEGERVASPLPVRTGKVRCAPHEVGGLPTPVGGEGALPAPTFVVSGAAQAAADALLRTAGLAAGAPLLAVHPGSGAYSVARRWFPDRFAMVASELSCRYGLGVVLLGSEDERALADTVMGHMCRPAANLAGRTSLEELGGVLRRCALLVGNDAGVAHLASAVGTPVVAIFGPFNHHTWRPLGRSLVVRAEPALPCMPCVNRGFSRGYPEGCPPRYCLQEVTPAMVVAAAARLLGGP
jgi:ADP-heptose:LPS heptosyltransferase